MPGFRLFRPSIRLQWKLTFSYVMVTVLGVVAIEAIGMAILAHSIWKPVQVQLLEQIEAKASQAAVCMESTTPRDKMLSMLVNAPFDETSPGGDSRDMGGSISIHMHEKLSVAIIDTDGLVRAASSHSWEPNTSMKEGFSRSEIRLIRQAPSSESVVTKADRTIFTTAPIKRKDGKTLGTLVGKLVVPYTPYRLTRAVFGFLLPSAIMVTLFAAVFGTLFGFLTARKLTSRLNNIATAADSWSRGEFSRIASDSTDDELGLLSRRLDQMAGQLDEHFRLREHLAGAEERNRIARDLHDTVKQQAFAAAMHIGAAQSISDKEASDTGKHLDEASNLVHGIQKDLSAIIRELRPPMRGGSETPTAAIHDYAADWSRQTGISATVTVEEMEEIGKTAGETLLRIVQGALSNTARHSMASCIQITLRKAEEAEAVLLIMDDGKGFDPESHADGAGLGILRERAESLPGGAFHLESRPDSGTKIEVRFSLKKEALQ